MASPTKKKPRTPRTPAVLLQSLPSEIHGLICAHLDTKSLLLLAKSCKLFALVVANEAFLVRYVSLRLNVSALPFACPDHFSHSSLPTRVLFSEKVDALFEKYHLLSTKYHQPPSVRISKFQSHSIPTIRLHCSDNRSKLHSNKLASSSGRIIDIWSLSTSSYYKYVSKLTLRNPKSNSDFSTFEISSSEYNCRVFSGNVHGNIETWDITQSVAPKTPNRVLHFHKSEVKAIHVVDPDFFLSTSFDKSLAVWDVARDDGSCVISKFHFNDIGKDRPICLTYLPRSEKSRTGLIVVGLSSLGRVRSSSEFPLIRLLELTPSGNIISANQSGFGKLSSDFSKIEDPLCIRGHGSSVTGITKNV
ncbi:hypothetical protein HK096_010625, partial [Nowakowskiella sp. JEL0078]